MSERGSLKRQEEAMMLEALGLKAQVSRQSGKSMEQHEIDELCRRGNIANEERGILHSHHPPLHPISIYVNRVKI